MRIGFMGVQGTGKSTLVDMFLSYHQDYTRSVNLQRILNAEFGLNINGGADFITQFAISAHYASEVVLHENYISDRTILDTFVYAKTCKKISNEEIEYIENTFIKSVDKYDAIFYLPIEFEPPEDGVRVVDKDYRNEVSELMLYYKEKYTDNVYTLKGSIKDRYIQMLQILNTIKDKQC